jgi:type I restriction-modification system DNA methylase subunit
MNPSPALCSKAMSDTKSKAGQYFTPRALIDSIIRICSATIKMRIQRQSG